MPALPAWGPHGLRLRRPGLLLSATTEADLPLLGELLPPDVELDPAAVRHDSLDAAHHRCAVLFQTYWSALGRWSARAWALPFTVWRVDEQTSVAELVGMQWVESEQWDDRVVDSSSWLVVQARGRGVGRAMRAAVLDLAFAHLGARAAVTSAYPTNLASLGVSRRLGYRETHQSVLEHSGEQLRHLRLEAADWRASPCSGATVVDGLAEARPFFGKGADA